MTSSATIRQGLITPVILTRASMYFSKVRFVILSPTRHVLIILSIAVYIPLRIRRLHPHVLPANDLQAIMDVVAFVVMYSIRFFLVSLLSK